MSTTVTPAPDLTSREAPAVRVRVAGRLGSDAVGEFHQAVQEVQTLGADRLIVLDLARVEVSDHDGLQALDTALRLRGAAAGNVVVRGVSAAVDEVLRVDRHLEDLRKLQRCA